MVILKLYLYYLITTLLVIGSDISPKTVPGGENISELVQIGNELPIENQINSADIHDRCNKDSQTCDEEIIDKVYLHC